MVCADGKRLQPVRQVRELHNGDVVLTCSAHDPGGYRIRRMKLYMDGVGGFDDMEIGHDMTALIPHETRSGALRHFGPNERIELQLLGCDRDNRGRCGQKELDGAFLPIAQLSRWG